MKRSIAATAMLLCLILLSGSARADASTAMEVIGRVTDAARPIENALVVAFDVTGYYTRQTFSLHDGSFHLAALPSSVYRLIVVKNGFMPGVLTISPERTGQRIAVKLQNESLLSREQKNQRIWEIRRAVPADVLRELNLALPEAVTENEAPRFRGEMASVAAVSEGSTSANYTQTDLGLEAPIGDGWSVGIKGRLHRTDENGAFTSGGHSAESSGMSMRLQTAPGNTVTLASTRNSWRPTRLSGTEDGADLEWHKLQWAGSSGNLQVRYLAQQNVLDREDLHSSELFELTGGSHFRIGTDAGVDISVRLQQEIVPGYTGDLSLNRRADVISTAGSRLTSNLDVRYGVRAFLRNGGGQFAPETSANFRVGTLNSIHVSGLYKMKSSAVADSSAPSLALFGDSLTSSPLYRYSIGFTRGNKAGGEIVLVASQSGFDEAIRVVFSETDGPLWDSFTIRPGDLQRDVRVSFQRKVAGTTQVNLAASAGRTIGVDQPLEARDYFVGTVATLYQPSGTSIDVSYRYVDKEEFQNAWSDAENERLNLRVGQSLQSLRAPAGITLLLGVDLARQVARPMSSVKTAAVERRLIGGLAFSF